MHPGRPILSAFLLVLIRAPKRSRCITGSWCMASLAVDTERPARLIGEWLEVAAAPVTAEICRYHHGRQTRDVCERGACLLVHWPSSCRFPLQRKHRTRSRPRR